MSDTNSKKTRGYLSLGTYSKLLHLADLRVPLGICLPKHSPHYTHVSNPKQKRQREALRGRPRAEVPLGFVFFNDRNDPNSWWHTPRERLPGNVLNALVCGVTGTHSGFSYCGACTEPLENHFISKCIVFTDDVGLGE